MRPGGQELEHGLVKGDRLWLKTSSKASKMAQLLIQLILQGSMHAQYKKQKPFLVSSNDITATMLALIIRRAVVHI